MADTVVNTPIENGLQAGDPLPASIEAESQTKDLKQAIAAIEGHPDASIRADYLSYFRPFCKFAQAMAEAGMPEGEILDRILPGEIRLPTCKFAIEYDSVTDTVADVSSGRPEPVSGL